MTSDVYSFPAAARDFSRRGGVAGRCWDTVRSNGAFWILALFLALAFLTGGGSRGDIESLMYLRPVSVLTLAYGLANLKSTQFRAHRLMLGLSLAALLLVLSHLVPLPPSVWAVLPGRDVIAEIDRAAALGAQWRPLSMVPVGTRNAAWAMVAPLAVLVLGLQLTREQLASLVPLVVGMGLASALLGLLQIMNDAQSPLYFYDVTTPGLPVGLFANRNHQAMFLAMLFPMLLVWARSRAAKSVKRANGRLGDIVANGSALAIGAVIVPMILITGSRAGMALAVASLLAIPFMLVGVDRARRGPSDKPDAARWAKWIVPIVITGLTAASIMAGRALSVDRLLASGREVRVAILPEVISLIERYLPWGSGIGSFQEVYALYEPRILLADKYMNHAHDDWLELAMTGGVPALALMSIAITAFVVRGFRLFFGRAADGDRLLGRLGFVVLLLFAVGSVSDYPLRTPALLCLAAIALLWFVSEKLTTTQGLASKPTFHDRS